MATSANFSTATGNGTSILFGIGLETQPASAAILYNAVDIDGTAKNFTPIRWGGADASVTDGDNPTDKTYAEGTTKSLSLSLYRNSYTLTSRLQRIFGARYPEEISNARGRLDASTTYTLNQLMWNVLANGLTSTTDYTGGLLFSAHTIEAGGTVTNSAASALSISTYITARTVMANMLGSEATYAPRAPTFLCVAPALRDTADNVAHNVFNGNNYTRNSAAFVDGLKVVECPFFGAALWVLAVPAYQGGLTIAFGQRPIIREIAPSVNRANSLELIAEYDVAVGAVDWRGYYGSST